MDVQDEDWQKCRHTILKFAAEEEDLNTLSQILV
jgi:hypothetical protein